MSTIARGTLVNLAARVGAIGLGISITVLIARIAPAAQGRFALLTSIEALLLALFSGFGVALARHVSHGGEDPRRILGATFRVCLTIGAGCALCLAGVSAVSSGAYASLWILSLSAPILLLPPSLGGVWLGQGRMKPLGFLAVAGPLLTLLFFAGYWLAAPLLGPNEIVAMLVSWVLARVAVGLAVVWGFRGSLAVRPDWAALRGDARFIAVIGATNLVGLANYRSDLFLIEHFLGLSATGVYSIAIMVAELLWLLSSAVTVAAYARIGTAARDESARVVVDIVHANLALLLLAAPFLYLGARFVLPWLLGPGYGEVPLLLAVVLPGVMSYGAASPLSAYFTNHVGRPLVSAIVAALSLALNVGLCFVLIPRIGIFGGAVATTVSYLLSVLLMVALFVREAGAGAASLLARPDWRAARQYASVLLASLQRGRA